MEPDDFRKLLEKYERGDCTPQEKELIEAWYNALPEDDMLPPPSTGERIWSGIQQKNNLRKYSISTWLKIAAVIAMFVLVGTMVVSRYQKTDPGTVADMQAIPVPPDNTQSLSFENTTQIPQQLRLADGSIIVLQPGGRVSYPSEFDTDSRKVSLSGEAFFDIQRDEQRPFYVFTREVVTKVLGTSFTIKANEKDREITVAVKTGKVRVYTNPRDEENPTNSVTLTPNQKIVYNREAVEISKQLVEKPEIVLEKPTLFEMKYDGVSVIRIFQVLEENYGVEIDFDEALWNECVLTTKMSDEGLMERIEIITKAIGATYSVNDAVIKIEGAGCN